MLAHDFHIERLQPLAPRRTRHVFKRGRIAYYENIFIQPAVTAFGFVMNPNRMHQRQPIRCQWPRNRGKLTVKMAHADMFKHAHQNNPVKTAALTPVIA